MAQLLGVLEQGLIYAILALGVYITFKILDFPDMTVDSSFPLGAAVTALMISGGLNPLWSLPASLIAGALAGAITGVIHVRFRVGGLLSGIIVMTGLYSVNLHIAGRSNVQLFSFDTLFKNPLISGLPARGAALCPGDRAGAADVAGQAADGRLSGYPFRLPAAGYGRQSHAGGQSGQGAAAG